MEAATPPAQPEGPQTQEQAVGVGQAAATGAHQNPENPQQGAQQGAQEYAAQQGFKLSDEDARKIAGFTVEALRQAQALEQPPPPAPATGQPAPADGNQPPSAGAEPAPTPGAAPSGDEQPTRKRSFADKLRGTGG